MQFNNLFSPMKINNLEIRNRIFMSPMGTLFANDNNEITEELIGYYAARARGGAGLITTETAIIDELGKYGTFRNIALYDDTKIAGWSRLANEIHNNGAKLAAQLFHPAMAALAEFNQNMKTVAASPVVYRLSNDIPRPLSIEEIQLYVEKFGEAARRAKEAGCDAIELHCCHRHGLLGNFLSPLHNKRVDRYGGNVDGRLTFPLEVMARIIEKVGNDFPIIVRISATDMEVGGQSIMEGCYIAKRFEEAGAAMLHVSNGSRDNGWVTIAPSGSGKAIHNQYTEKIKQCVKIPVGIVGRINEPWVADMLIETEKADAVYMGRALLCDPEFPNKAQRGNCSEIRPCIGCLECIVSISRDEEVCCSMNPFVGKETKPIQKTEDQKKVLVIGGGPGGLEAANLAQLRGHDVTIMEKSERLGGQAYIAAFPPTKQDISHGIKYLIEQASNNGVKFELGKDVTVDTVKQFNPGAIILATGSRPLWPKFLNNCQANVVSAWNVLEGICDTGHNIVVIGGSQVGCEVADFLAHPYNDRTAYGKKVTIIELQDNILIDDRSNSRSLLVRRLQEKGINIITGAKVEAVLENSIQFSRNGKEEILEGIDTIVAALGSCPENRLAKELQGVDIPIHVIGDAKQSRKIIHAISEGAEAAQIV